jgi:Zn-finger nucleic acid-binding protein
MADRQSIEIDYCPSCRGVWLDRGELDKIIERSAEVEARTAAPEPVGDRRNQEERYQDDRYRDDRYGDDRYRDKRYRKRGLLGDLFDFD